MDIREIIKIDWSRKLISENVMVKFKQVSYSNGFP